MSSPTETVFSQTQSLGERTLVLRRDRVVIIDKIGGETRERHIQLSDLASPIEFFDRRFLTETVVLIFFFAVFFVASLKVAGPSRVSDILQLTLGTLAFSFLFGLPFALRRIPCARVRNKRGEVLFELYRQRKVALPYEEFLLQLQRQLKALEG
jgi:hypothetical protein